MYTTNDGHEFTHAPGSTLDYGFDWSAWLASGETITDSSWAITGGLTLSQSQITGGVTSTFVGGGVSGTIYKLVNTITTSASRVDSRTITLSCKQR
jgi:hypothetical protein